MGSKSSSSTAVNASTNDSRVASADQGTSIGAGFAGTLAKDNGVIVSGNSPLTINQIIPDAVQNAFNLLGGVAQSAIKANQDQLTALSGQQQYAQQGLNKYVPLLLLFGGLVLIMRR